MLLEEKHKAFKSMIASDSSAAKCMYQLLRNNLQREFRLMKDNWWRARAREIQEYADKQDLLNFFCSMKEIWGPRACTPTHILSADGQHLLNEKSELLKSITVILHLPFVLTTSYRQSLRER